MAGAGSTLTLVSAGCALVSPPSTSRPDGHTPARPAPLAAFHLVFQAEQTANISNKRELMRVIQTETSEQQTILIEVIDQLDVVNKERVDGSAAGAALSLVLLSPEKRGFH
jgi:hypothetical protein